MSHAVAGLGYSVTVYRLFCTRPSSPLLPRNPKSIVHCLNSCVASPSTVHTCVHVTSLQEFTSKDVLWPDVSIQMMPTASIDLPVVSLMKIGAPILFVIAYVYFLQYFTIILVSEKETMVKEHLLMMGMRLSAYW